MKIFILFTVALQLTGATWSKIYKLTATGVTGSSDQTNFPCYVHDTSGTLATVAHGGVVTNSSGYDIVFSANSAISSYIPWEVERWNATTGDFEAWTLCSTLYGTGSSPTQTVIYVAAGNSSITTQQNTGGAVSTSVWDTNYKLVLHLPNGSTLSGNDSTINAANGSLDAIPPTATTGQIDGAGLFVSNTVTPTGIRATTGIPTSWATNRSFSGWLNCTNFTGNVNFPYLAWIFLASNTSGGWGVTLGDQTSSHAGMLTYANRGSAVFPFTSLQAVLSHQTFVAVSVNGTSATGYMWDLTASTSASQTITVANPSNADGGWNLGDGDNGSLISFVGMLDEAELSSTNRSSDWITDEFTNQSTPGVIGTPGFWTWSMFNQALPQPSVIVIQ